MEQRPQSGHAEGFLHRKLGGSSRCARAHLFVLYSLTDLCCFFARRTIAALIYNGFNSTLDSYRGGKHDIYGSMFAGACTGVVWRCTGEFRGSAAALSLSPI